MPISEAHIDGVGALPAAANNVRSKAATGGYLYRFADTGDSTQHDDRRAGHSTACVPVSSEERRRARRHLLRLPLTMCVFNQGAFFPAQMVNYSQDGLGLETFLRILPGTSIHARIDTSQAAALEKPVFPGLRTTALGEVKWCRILGQGDSPRYIAGIRYHSYY